MRRLPPLVHGSARWHLPLTEAAASRVLAAVVTEPRDARIARWVSVLRLDPALVLWGVCRADCWRARPPAGLGELAAWFADRAPLVLQWPATLRAEEAAAENTAWTARAQDAVAAAQQTAREAGQNDQGAAYLHGLLAHAAEWLNNWGPPPDSLPQPPWPSWLFPLSRTEDRSRPPPRPEPVPAAADADIEAASETSTAESPLPDVMRKLQRLHRLEHDFQNALETEKLAALKELAYGASHEINNPLANISTRAQTLIRDEPDPDRRRQLAVINAQAFRAHEMIADMMLFARPPALRKEAIELEQLVDQVLEELAETAAAQATRLERVPGEAPGTILADPEQLAVALKALCTNALESLASGGWVQVAFGPATAQPAGFGETRATEIRIRDNGPGIPPQVRRHLFDPYYSGREAGRGLGLGLAKCWRIITDHGGQIHVDSDTPCGTTFRLLLPCALD